MKHIKTFESFSPIKEELGFSDLKSWVNKNADLVRKFVDDLKTSKNPEVAKLLGKVETLAPEEKENAVEGVESVEAEAQAVKENLFKKVAGNTMTWLGKLSQYGAGGGLVYSLTRAVMGDEGLMDKFQAYHPAGVTIGHFIALCCAALVGGIIVSKIGQAIRK